MEKFPSDWQGGKIFSNPVPVGKAYRGSVYIKGRRNTKLFSWSRYESKEHAFQACSAWIHDLCLKNDLILNRYRYINQNQLEVELNKEKKKYGIIDCNDLPLFEKYTWYSFYHHGNFYVKTTFRDEENERRTISFHRSLFPEWKEIDHKGMLCNLYSNF